MKKIAVLTFILCALTTLMPSSQAQVTCIGCNRSAYCQTNSTKGGCGCIQGYHGGYRLCAVCGVCVFTFCIYPCGGAAATQQAMQPIPLTPLASWVTNTDMVPSIKGNSPATGELLKMLQDRYKNAGACSTLHGRIVNETISTEGADWEAVIASTGAEVAVHFYSGREERVSITQTGWSFKRDKEAMIIGKLQ
jgi:hypothetical protein